MYNIARRGVKISKDMFYTYAWYMSMTIDGILGKIYHYDNTNQEVNIENGAPYMKWKGTEPWEYVSCNYEYDFDGLDVSDKYYYSGRWRYRSLNMIASIGTLNIRHHQLIIAIYEKFDALDGVGLRNRSYDTHHKNKNKQDNGIVNLILLTKPMMMEFVYMLTSENV